ncbi:hypothetical protein B0H17DRAFT_125096 [Mycena rosella]|uniref:Uncharacterized protein n=1 Tax=Mycena rosella TaxID=1033263 RepID=A0AAD7D701_MYCRO|nr:hypothetical protein B0H17DRAFT_125096 [Mycena rosella]
MEKLLRLASPSLVHLVMEPYWVHTSQNQIADMFARLPPLPALRSLTLWLSANRRAEIVVNAFTAAPNLETLIFRIGFREPEYEDDEDRQYLEAILRLAFPWGSSESMNCALKHKFPLIKRLGFHFCPPCNSALHFRGGLRKRMEWRLKEHLAHTGADVAGYIEVDWLDDDYNPVAYDKMSGKAPWKAPPDLLWEDLHAENEAIDCESEKSDEDVADDLDSDGYPRTWPADDVEDCSYSP